MYQTFIDRCIYTAKLDGVATTEEGRFYLGPAYGYRYSSAWRSEKLNSSDENCSSSQSSDRQPDEWYNLYVRFPESGHRAGAIEIFSVFMLKLATHIEPIGVHETSLMHRPYFEGPEECKYIDGRILRHP
jgi:hypothetical protein